jgi:Fe2+ or Zn2+ uptake regulation protein
LSKAAIYNTLILLINAKLVRVLTIEDNETGYVTAALGIPLSEIG